MDSGTQDFNFPPISFFSRSHAPESAATEKGPQSLQRFFLKNLRLQCKVLDPRHYLLAIGGTCDREELAWITLGKSRGIGDGQYNHPLPWFGPMLFENSMEQGLIKLKYSLPRPLINAQTHPNSSNHVKSVSTVKPIFQEKTSVILVHVRYLLYRRDTRTWNLKAALGPKQCRVHQPDRHTNI